MGSYDDIPIYGTTTIEEEAERFKHLSKSHKKCRFCDPRGENELHDDLCPFDSGTGTCV